MLDMALQRCFCSEKPESLNHLQSLVFGNKFHVESFKKLWKLDSGTAEDREDVVTV